MLQPILKHQVLNNVLAAYPFGLTEMQSASKYMTNTMLLQVEQQNKIFVNGKGQIPS